MKKYLFPLTLIIVLTLIISNLIIKEIKNRYNVDYDSQEETKEDIITEEQIYGEDIVILMSKNIEDKELELKLLNEGKPQTLTYDGTTSIVNRYKSQITAAQLECGAIYNIRFSKRDRKLESIEECTDAFTLTDVSNIEFDETKGIIRVNNSQYKYDDNLLIFSNDEIGDMIDINEIDTFTVRGYGKKVYSINVDKGHGYLRLTNEAYFINGWIEVGSEIIKPITSEMLMTVPEGKYTVTVRNRGYAGSKDVKIVRDKETKLDLSEIDIKEVAIGHVQFTLEPVYAQLYIDNEITDYDERVPVEYGTHEVRVEAAGYKTVYTSIKVFNDYADIKISLEEDDTDSSKSSSSSSSTTDSRPMSTTIDGLVYSIADASSSSTQQAVNNTSSSSSTMNYSEAVSDVEKIYIDGPSGAEVYLDGSYIGIAPISTTKVTGTHIVTLKKNGYESKDYTVSIDNDGKNVTYSFSDLLEKSE